ncbi:MAG: hypothetical protein J5927_04270 [Oscillospiraceae bacterium]|nr:hypothetical protein [Oscillospiraceae bacterium]
MEGNIYKSAGVAVGIVIGLIVAVALILIANNNRKIKTEYDERQLKVRGDAYRFAFYTVMIWEVILFVLAFGEVHFSIPDYVLHFAGLLAGILVLSGYCIWRDAYWGLNNNRKRYGIILVVAGLLNAIPLFGGPASWEATNFPYVNLLVCAMLLLVGVELLLKHLLDKRAGDSEDEA